MKTAKETYEQIFERDDIFYYPDTDIIDDNISNVGPCIIEAMEEYAEQKAIAFLKFIECNNITNNTGIPPHILYKMFKNQTDESKTAQENKTPGRG